MLEFSGAGLLAIRAISEVNEAEQTKVINEGEDEKKNKKTNKQKKKQENKKQNTRVSQFQCGGPGNKNESTQRNWRSICPISMRFQVIWDVGRKIAGRIEIPVHVFFFLLLASRSWCKTVDLGLQVWRFAVICLLSFVFLTLFLWEGEAGGGK